MYFNHIVMNLGVRPSVRPSVCQWASGLLWLAVGVCTRGGESWGTCVIGLPASCPCEERERAPEPGLSGAGLGGAAKVQPPWLGPRRPGGPGADGWTWLLRSAWLMSRGEASTPTGGWVGAHWVVSRPAKKRMMRQSVRVVTPDAGEGTLDYSRAEVHVCNGSTARWHGGNSAFQTLMHE